MLTKVKVLAQIRKIAHRDITTMSEAPWSVVKEINNDIQGQIIAIAKVLGYKWNGKIYMPRHAPPINTWVYLAPDELVKEFYSVPEKQGIHVGYLISRPRVPVYLNIKGINRHIAIIATTGSGKTWTSIVLIEELLRKGATILVLDPHGEYVKIKDSIHRLGTEYLNSVTIVKGHKDQEGDILYKVSIKNLSHEELAAVAGIPSNASRIRTVLHGVKSLATILAEAFNKPKMLSLKSLRILTESAITAMEHKSSLRTFYTRLSHELRLRLNLDLANLEKNPGYAERIMNAVRRIWLGLKRDADIGFDLIRYLENLARIGVYGSKTISLEEILKPRHITIFNLSGLRKEVQDHLAYNILSRIFKARVNFKRGLKGEKYPYPIVVIVEEAHRFAPPKSIEDTWSREILAKIAAEGRKFGVFLVVITQRPSKIDPDILSQCQSQIISKIVNPRDQDAIRDASEQLSQDLLENLPGLNPGEIVVVGPLTPAPVMLRVRDRVLDYAGRDIDVVKEWSHYPEELHNLDSIITRLRTVLELSLGVKALNHVELAKATTQVISMNNDADYRAFKKAVELVANNSIGKVRYDEDVGLISGEVNGETVEIRLSDGTWKCSCGKLDKPCLHVYSVFIKAVTSKVIDVDQLKKWIKLRTLNMLL